MGILEAAAMLALAVAIVIAALLLRSAVLTALAAYRQNTATLTEHRQNAAKQQEVFVQIAKAFEKIAESVYGNHLQMLDYNNFGQFNKLVRAIEDCSEHLEKLVTPPADQTK